MFDLLRNLTLLAVIFLPMKAYGDEPPVWTRTVWGLQAWWTDGTAKPGHDSTHLHLDTDFPVGYGKRRKL